LPSPVLPLQAGQRRRLAISMVKTAGRFMRSS
jgi:hypothetical protein